MACEDIELVTVDFERWNSAVPFIGMARHYLQGQLLTITADEERHRRLRRQWPHRRVLEAEMLSLVVHRLAAPESANNCRALIKDTEPRSRRRQVNAEG